MIWLNQICFGIAFALTSQASETPKGFRLETRLGVKGEERPVVCLSFDPGSGSLVSLKRKEPSLHPELNNMGFDTRSSLAFWNLASGKRVQELGFDQIVWRVAFDAKGRLFATLHFGEGIRLWTASDRKTVRKISHEWCYGLSFGPDAETMASAGMDGSVQLVNVKTGRLVKTLSDHDSGITSVAFSPDGKSLASASYDSTVSICDTRSGKRTHVLRHSEMVLAVSYSPNGKLVASGSRDKTARLWDAVSGRAVATLRGHTRDVSAVAFSPDGKMIACASWDGTVSLWSTATYKRLGTIGGQRGEIHCVTFSPEGRKLITGGQDGTIGVWTIER